jgi:hypothetical protein
LGNFQSNFVFTDEDEMKKWIDTELPILEEKYGKLEYRTKDLPGFKIGDSCMVWGEGHEVFKILNLIKYSSNRYGFLLDSGWTEEVAKCHWTPPTPRNS